MAMGQDPVPSAPTNQNGTIGFDNHSHLSFQHQMCLWYLYLSIHLSIYLLSSYLFSQHIYPSTNPI